MKRTLIGVFLCSLLLLPHVATAATYFYVDPDCSGTPNGSASNPWRSLSDSGAWTSINNALASDDVTVYFSAREAGSDTDQTTTIKLTIKRTNTSSHRLTLDGMSKWNTNDTTPSWMDYSGDSRFHISPGSTMALAQQSYTVQSYITVRGFKVTCPNNAYGISPATKIWRGNHWIWEYCDIYGGENAFLLEYAQYGGPGSAAGGGSTDITIRNNTIRHAYREVLYIGGCHNETGDPHHDQITIENNIVSGGGPGEVDGIDIKDEITNLVVRGNHVYDCDTTGISSHSGGIFEDNIVHDCGRCGISYNDYWGQRIDSHTATRIRNNIVYRCATRNNSSDYSLGVKHSGSLGITDVVISNNTVYDGHTTGIYISGASGINGLIIKNNISFNNSSYDFYLTGGNPSGTVQHDYNCYYKSSGNVYSWNGTTKTAITLTEAESHSVGQDPAVVDEVGHDYQLTSSSPCINAGTTITGFSDDITGLSRPQGAAWDIGAYEYTAASAPAAPTGVEAHAD